MGAYKRTLENLTKTEKGLQRRVVEALATSVDGKSNTCIVAT